MPPMDELTVPLLVACLVDRLLGDPPCRFHPVRLMGGLAATLEAGLFCLRLSGRWGGAALVTLNLVSVVAIYVAARAAVQPLHPLATLLLDGFALYSCLALQSLLDHLRPVEQALNEGDLQGAQEAVQRIVSREARRLDGAGVSRAAVESTAENFVDAFFAPLFWYVLIGIGSSATIPGPGVSPSGVATAGVLVYRTINTLDAMVGYRNERYRRFGWASARLDDLVNFLPARLAILMLHPAAILVGLNARRGLATWWRDRSHHPSPNAGQTESYAAGALEIRLGGPTVYPHGLVEKAWLGDGRPEATATHVRACGRLVQAAGWLSLGVALLLTLSVQRRR